MTVNPELLAQGVLSPTMKRSLELADDLADMEVCCRKCSATFIFSATERQLFCEKSWPIPRQRCEECTERRKAKKVGGMKTEAEKERRKEKKVEANKAKKARREESGSDADVAATATAAVPAMVKAPVVILPPAVNAVKGSAGAPKRRGKGGIPDGVCYNCGEPGHLSMDCPQPRSGNSYLRPSGGKTVCYRCHQEGHMTYACSLPGPHIEGGSKGEGKGKGKCKGNGKGNGDAGGKGKRIGKGWGGSS